MALHEDLGPNLTATVIITGLLAFITMGLRVYTRVTKRNWGIEDTVMSIGCIPLLVLTIVTTIGSYYGIGAKDSTFARPGNQKYVETAYFWFFLYEVFYCTSIIFVKLSIAFMLNRIAGNKKIFIYTNYGIMGLCASVNLAAALYIIFQCNPVEAAWKAELMAEGGYCQAPVYLQNVYYFCSSVNIFTDWATALMPIPLLWNVQMNLNTKISVAGVLGLGIFTSISGLVRMNYTVNLTSSVDYLYGLANILIWGYAEPALGMMVGNIATLRPLFRRMLDLGSDGSAGAQSKGAPGGSEFPNRSHPYKSFDHDYELGLVAGNKASNIHSTQIHGPNIGRGSLSSDNESQKEILEKSIDQFPRNKGIVVSQQGGGTVASHACVTNAKTLIPAKPFSGESKSHGLKPKLTYIIVNALHRLYPFSYVHTVFTHLKHPETTILAFARPAVGHFTNFTTLTTQVCDSRLHSQFRPYTFRFLSRIDRRYKTQDLYGGLLKKIANKIRKDVDEPNERIRPKKARRKRPLPYHDLLRPPFSHPRRVDREFSPYRYTKGSRKPLLGPVRKRNTGLDVGSFRLQDRQIESIEAMDTSLFLITAPTADTAGTTLMLQSPKRSYVFGNMSEGTQRAITQMGSRLVKVQDFFITGRTEWRNIGGLIGMSLTLADVTSTSYETSMEVYRKKASKSKVSEPERPKLSVHGPPNLKHLLSTCRRFIFRKGMPINAIEYKSNDPIRIEQDTILPSWQDDVIKVWAMSIAPANQVQDAQAVATLAQRRKSFDARLNDFDDHRAPEKETSEERDARYDLIRTSVLKQMFDSSWTFDTLVERPISEVEMPAAMYIRNPRTHRLEPYSGPIPTSDEPLPDVKVLTRTPWPAALVFNLPPTEPMPEAVSYIVRSHTARGKFDVRRAKELGVLPGRAYSQLTAGESVVNGKGDIITPGMVVGEDRLGQGVAILDVPSVDYLSALLRRKELVSDSVMEGVHTYIWILGAGVAGHSMLNDFMEKLNHVQHVVSSPDTNPNHLSMDSVAAQTIRLGQIDGDRYHIPSHDNTTLPQKSFRNMDESPKVDIASNAIVAERGMKWRVMPKYELQMESVPPFVNVAAVQQETSPEILELVRTAHANIDSSKEAHEVWKQSVARPDSEIITLGTGSALPSKYRNVSATLVRIPGIGNYLFDCGENTIGQLQRVFNPEELVDVFRNLRVIWISHLHADHHLGTASVIKAWYEVVHKNTPLHSSPSAETIASNASDYGLAVISHTGMLRWLYEYASVEDFGYSRILPLNILPAAPGNESGSKLVLSGSTVDQNEHVISPKDYQSILGFSNIQATLVRHCHGAMAVSITFPSEDGAPEINPLKVSYSGDCRPSADFATIGKNTTVLIHEATFDDELQGDARAKKHSTTSEALGIGAKMDAKGVVLTHFSQRYQKIPVLETVQDSEDETLPATANVTNGNGIDDQDVEMTAPDPIPSASPAPKKETSKEQIIKIRNPDMKVAIAFDYMRVKIGDIAKLEKFNDALNKLLVTDEDDTKGAKKGEVGLNGNGKKNGDGKDGGKTKKAKRMN